MSMRSMTARRENLNTSKAETAAHTLSYIALEVPNSQGALSVEMTHYEVGITPPEKIASTKTSVDVMVQTGKKTPASIAFDTEDVISNPTWFQESGVGAVHIQAWHINEMSSTRRIPIRPEQGGRYYITLCIAGSAANTTAKTVYGRFEFDVYR